jgi:hypothetical protein
MELKKVYQEKSDAQLREWLGWIEDYKTASPLSMAGKPIDRLWITRRLEDSHRLACIRLDELRNSNDDHWELAKQAVERAMIELKHVIDESGIGQSGRFLQIQTNRSYVYEPFQRRRG